MTNDDQYAPSEDDVRIAYVDEWVAQSDFLTRHQEREAERAGEAAWDRFLARVRRDAAANALYEVATDIDNYDDYLMVHNRAKRIEETP